ncbi:ATP-dependent nuclease [Listeria fleischmannii]|uniref:ATP-dependent nuclease n=1 Tax=Listeria fleischmannii TaxID=1069827 RepID=UPI001626E932|nr:AAA family ATPase [Listeria fleischmannii]MBC1419343.1 AAA family ATPase [Listeria fleischmannii]
MKINKLRISNYKMFTEEIINLNTSYNIFVGDNDAGKSTLLEVIQIITSNKLNGYSFEKQIKVSMFNNIKREEFQDDLLLGNNIVLPEIILEAYCDLNDEYSKYKGTNNELGEDCPGIRVKVSFDSKYAEEYKEMMSQDEIVDIPIEFYKVDWDYFSGEPVLYRTSPVKTTFIDTTKKDYSSSLNRFVNNNVTSNLADEEINQLTRAYRKMRLDFNSNGKVNELNKRIAETHRLDGKTISFGLKESNLDSWLDEISIEIENIPFENIGFGSQNMIKMELAYQEKSEKSNVILFEEPENNLSFTNMSRLISKINQDSTKQVFISTHSSFVTNKIGISNIIMLNKGCSSPLKEVNEDTLRFFKKLPNYDTLRFLLSERAILVEGPTDELIIQRSYLDKYGKLPIENGIDIIAVGSLAFKRYCDLALLVKKNITIFTDNDKNIENKIKEKYKDYLSTGLVEIYYDLEENLNTIEPSTLEVNCQTNEEFDLFKKIIGKNDSLKNRDKQGILDFMINNKTEWSLRVFEATERIKYPNHIYENIKK